MSFTLLPQRLLNVSGQIVTFKGIKLKKKSSFSNLYSLEDGSITSVRNTANRWPSDRSGTSQKNETLKSTTGKTSQLENLLQLLSAVGAVQRSNVWRISASYKPSYVNEFPAPQLSGPRLLFPSPWLSSLCLRVAFPLSFPTVSNKMCLWPPAAFQSPQFWFRRCAVLNITFLLTLVSWKPSCFPRITFRIFDSSALPQWRGVIGRYLECTRRKQSEAATF